MHGHIQLEQKLQRQEQQQQHDLIKGTVTFSRFLLPEADKTPGHLVPPVTMWHQWVGRTTGTVYDLTAPRQAPARGTLRYAGLVQQSTVLTPGSGV